MDILFVAHSVVDRSKHANETYLEGAFSFLSFVPVGRGHAGARGGSETPCARPACCAAIPLSSFATLFRPVPGARRHSLRVSAASHLLRNESHTVSIGTQYRFLRRLMLRDFPVTLPV
jgi:hypothetical protein